MIITPFAGTGLTVVKVIVAVPSDPATSSMGITVALDIVPGVIVTGDGAGEIVSMLPSAEVVVTIVNVP